jgi:predicted NAD-dependent protein-ADP-ribosyltransferase YbiA (DUF1768 family)
MANLLSRLRKKNYLILLGAITVVVLLLVPYRSEAVKEHAILVLAEDGTPVPGVTVLRDTKGGSLNELQEKKTTDHEGKARFGPRYDFDNALFRVLRLAADSIDVVLTMGHRRRDVFISVSIPPTSTHDGSFGFAGFYASSQPPTELVIKRRDATDSLQEYPAIWFEPVDVSNKPEWEILPQEANPGEVILSKRNELGILSNFAATPFVLDGKRYQSVEGFWQMMLYPEGPGDERLMTKNIEWKYTREQVAQMTGFEAKSAGTLAEANMKTLGIDWCSYKDEKFPYRSTTPGRHYQLIEAAMRAKLEQNAEVKRILLATGDLILRPDHYGEDDPPPEWRYHEMWMQFRAQLSDTNQ